MCMCDGGGGIKTPGSHPLGELFSSHKNENKEREHNMQSVVMKD